MPGESAGLSPAVVTMAQELGLNLEGMQAILIVVASGV